MKKRSSCYDSYDRNIVGIFHHGSGADLIFYKSIANKQLRLTLL